MLSLPASPLLVRRCGALAAALLVALLLTACSGDDLPVHEDLSDDPVALVSHTGDSVTFPQAYRGEILVIGAIYTQCPDICPVVTGNMMDVRRQLEDTSDVRFVTVTFDPRRDTPERMKAHRSAFQLDNAHWPFLTGSTAAIDSLMAGLEIKTEISSGDTTGTYFIDHTDQITLVDEKGRIRYRYHGSGTPPELIIEDINKLRG
jgi:protein SCO1/2